MIFYDNNSSSNIFYPSYENDVDIRKEFHDLLFKENRGNWMIYRRTKMENGIPVKCECTKNNRSGEPDKDISCALCNGTGYLFKDYIRKTYVNNSQAYAIYKKVKRSGDSQVEYKTMYFEWNFLDEQDSYSSVYLPHRFDTIIRPEEDLQGYIESPIKIREKFEILGIDPYRLDKGGRIEYYRVRVISVIDKSFIL
jgi:hypothetical protein